MQRRALDSGTESYKNVQCKLSSYHAHILGHNKALDFNLLSGHTALVQSINVLLESKVTVFKVNGLNLVEVVVVVAGSTVGTS